ncbi:MAG: BREX system P-loop protein BrxC [Thiotrichaceae bacterium]|nr:BREX system P-loop protein BrxC [Thiotrichaceae bacterium]
MKIKNLFFKDLNRSINGVVKADQDDNATMLNELEEYVVTNELDRHFRGFFETYGIANDDPAISGQVGVWISGFFGSGKSHFLKVLSYLLANKAVTDAQGAECQALQFFDEHKIRDAMLRADIIKAVRNSTDTILFNIDSKASTNDGGNAIINVFLRVFNEHQGFSGDHPHIAHMERHLSEKGVYEQFKQAFHDANGSEWQDERDGYQFYQDDVEKAISVALDMSADAAHKWFEDSEQTFSVTVENFCHWVKEYLDKQTADHRIVFLVDEVGQFIGSDTKLMLTLQTITENLGTICKGRAWIVVTSQADMDAVLGELSSSKANEFSKIAGRFKTRLSLSSSNTDEVIQKRLLKKTPEAEAELAALFDKKGDILKNQISFDRSGPNMKNYDSAESFIDNYPFVPYHFQLVQKVFEEIRKVGATGAHLAYGERSMLDAFQMAANAIADKPVGALVPFYQFYSSVEGFLDNVVKRTIDQANENSVLDDFDSKMLRTLFMIRYVDLVKGTLNNLVTLSIEEVDSDKLALRKQIEASLQRLEKESLITRNGDEFLFLTNEERDITRKIKATDISSTEENKELGSLIYKDLLKDKKKFRYSKNKTDYTIGRYLDGHTLDGNYNCDLMVEVVTPLMEGEYSLYNEGFSITKSTEGQGKVLIKLSDDKQFFADLRTWLRTNKFIRLNSDSSQQELTRILADRGRENQERKNRLRQQMEATLANAEIYCLGQRLNSTSSSVSMLFDDACQYLLENTYTKLDYLHVLQDDPYRELKAVLTMDDVAQIGLTLDGEQGNPLATSAVEEHITLRASGNERILLTDIIEHFSKRPYGWADAEILLIVGRLAAAGRISLQLNGGTLPINEAFEPLQNSRRRREVSVIKKRQTQETILKQARSLTQDLFTTMGPAAEKELFEFYTHHFQQWLSNLKSYKSKTDVSHLPGKATIEQSILTLERLLSHNDSYDFFQQVVSSKDDYLNLEEDYRDIHEFFSTQLHTWQQLQTAIVHFDKNKQHLGEDEQANNALTELNRIAEAPAPYNMLHQVAGLISTVEGINNQLLDDRRAYAAKQVDEKVQLLEGEIQASSIATAELSNRLLRPLQLIKAELENETSISNLYMLQSQTAQEKLDDGLYELERTIQAEREKQQLAEQAAKQTTQPASTTESGEPAQPVVQPPPPAPKPVQSVSAAAVANRSSGRVYLEDAQQVDALIQQFSDELHAALKAGKRIRIQ